MKKKIEKMEFEEAIEELEKIIATLDEGNLSLKEASDLYTKGTQLKNHCSKILENIELKLNQISPREDETVSMLKEKEVEL